MRIWMAVWAFALCFARVGAIAQETPAGQALGQDTAGKPGEFKIPPASAYIGDAACRSCHRQQAGTYAGTAHHRTSSLPTPATVGGKFAPGKNVLQTADPNLEYEMQAIREGGKEIFTQSAVHYDEAHRPHRYTEPIDIVIGSGRKGKTYLYWKDDKLYELPVTWWVPDARWVNSPGFPDGDAYFDREIPPRCLDCHGSTFESLAPPMNRFRPASVVLGIGCEKCHGPGREHAQRERSASPPKAGSPRIAILNPARFPKERQLDLCANCHAGAATPIAPVLSYQPGDDIHKYLQIHDPGPENPVDVHGNQVLALERSRCYLATVGTPREMTCSTCHNVHQTQRDADAFSAKCLTCHAIEACGKHAEMGERIRDKCVDCHMPLQASQILFSRTGGEEIRPLVRSHRIAVYAGVTIP